MAVAVPERSPSMRSRLPDPERVEPWRDWAILAFVNHAILLAAAVWRPDWPWLLALALPLGIGLATATLTVLHDAGHRRFSRRLWPNVLATQTAAPVGLWVAYWTLKHRVHHRVTQVYPLDDATRASGLVRLHPSAPRLPVHRFQHIYAWFLYGLAWVGELRSQLTYVRTGVLDDVAVPSRSARLRSFSVEKALWLLVLAPYAVLMGPAKLALLLVTAMTIASAWAAVVLAVGHINTGLEPSATAPEGRAAWTAHLVRTSASFNTNSRALWWLTGGLTHHLAHHLRATAARGELALLHRTTVAEAVAASGAQLIEYPTLTSAVRGHGQRLRALGQPGLEPEPSFEAAPALAVTGGQRARRQWH